MSHINIGILEVHLRRVKDKLVWTNLTTINFGLTWPLSSKNLTTRVIQVIFVEIRMNFPWDCTWRIDGICWRWYGKAIANNDDQFAWEYHRSLLATTRLRGSEVYAGGPGFNSRSKRSSFSVWISECPHPLTPLWECAIQSYNSVKKLLLNKLIEEGQKIKIHLLINQEELQVFPHQGNHERSFEWNLNDHCSTDHINLLNFHGTPMDFLMCFWNLAKSWTCVWSSLLVGWHPWT